MTKHKRTDKRQTKPDTGIAIIPAPMSDGSTKNFPLKEAVRDAFNKRPHPSERKHQENVPVDASRMTTQELEAGNYSGYRVNHLKGTFEIWCIGRVAASERIDRVKKNPGVIADMHERAFSTAGSIVNVDLEVKTEEEIALEEKIIRGIKDS